MTELIYQIFDNAELTGGEILDISGGVLLAAYPENASVISVAPGDSVESLTFDRQFDCIVLYNTLADYPYPKRLLHTLAGLLKNGGRLTVAQLGGDAVPMPVTELKKLFDKYFDVNVMIENRHLYQVSGVKRDPLAHSHCGVTHSHGGLVHTHSHGDEAHTHTPRDGATPLDELLVLMRYLVNHNDAHAQEVADLAGELLTAGQNTAYDEIMDAVSDFDMVNAKLDAILNSLSVEEE